MAKSGIMSFVRKFMKMVLGDMNVGDELMLLINLTVSVGTHIMNHIMFKQ